MSFTLPPEVVAEGLCIGLVRGKTPIISPGIQIVTRSPYSHANAIFADGTVYEAESGGFWDYVSLSTNNSGCVVDIFAWEPALTPDEVAHARSVCDRLPEQGGLHGVKYDFVGIAGFVVRTNHESDDEARTKFCSSAIQALSMLMGDKRTLLARTQPFKVSPRDLNLSPRLRWVTTLMP